MTDAVTTLAEEQNAADQNAPVKTIRSSREGWALVLTLALLIGGLVAVGLAFDAAALVVGVVAGGLTAAGLMILKRIGQVVLVPWFHERLYRGQNFTGEWVLTTGKRGAQTGRLRLKQLGQRLYGDCTLIPKSGDPVGTSGLYEPLRDFDVEGESLGRLVRLNFVHKDSTRLGYGSFLLQVQGDGRVLEGLMTFFSVVQSHVTSTECVIRRPGAQTLSEATQLMFDGMNRARLEEGDEE